MAISLSKLTSGCRDLTFQNDNPFRNFSSPYPSAFRDPVFPAFLKTAHGVANTSRPGVMEGVEEAILEGGVPDTFVFMNDRYASHTLLAAVAARPTVGALKLLTSLLSLRKGENAWNVRLQSSRVNALCDMGGAPLGWVTLAFEAAVPLLLANSWEHRSVKAKEAVEEARKLFAAIDAGGRNVDWSIACDRTGETPLGFAARCMRGNHLAWVWPHLRARGADPTAATARDGQSPLDILEARAAQSVGLKDELEAAVAPLLAEVRRDRLETGLPPADQRSPTARM